MTRVVDDVNPPSHLARWRTRQAGAQQRIENQLGACQSWLAVGRDAQDLERLCFCHGRTRQSVQVSTGNASQQAPTMEVPGDGQSVAAVVAPATEHVGGSAAKSRQLPAGSLHQPALGDAKSLRRHLVDLLDLRACERW